MNGPSAVVVVGAGLVGLSTARALARRPGVPVVVIEAEDRPAAHQSGHNSGVLHAGLYYAPGSLKARLCRAGRAELIDFARDRGLPLEICGKLVVATSDVERPRLDELERRGRLHGLTGLRRLTPAEVAEREPHVAAVDALLVPETGITDFAAVARAIAADAAARGATLHLATTLRAVHRRADGLTLDTTAGELLARHVVACAGLHADRVARACGIDPGADVIPFRGEYHRLRPGARDLVRHLVYPVPDPALPFLGVHFTRTIGGDVEIGPNAVLAASRHGYRRGAFSPRDVLAMLGSRGFRAMLGAQWRTGLGEWLRSRSRRRTLAAMQRLVPDLRGPDIERARAGVRAQVVTPDGRLVDDFHVVGDDATLHVLNAPSPAATACLAIGEHVAALTAERFGLPAP